MNRWIKTLAFIQAWPGIGTRVDGSVSSYSCYLLCHGCHCSWTDQNEINSSRADLFKLMNLCHIGGLLSSTNSPCCLENHLVKRGATSSFLCQRGVSSCFCEDSPFHSFFGKPEGFLGLFLCLSLSHTSALPDLLSPRFTLWSFFQQLQWYQKPPRCKLNNRFGDWNKIVPQSYFGPLKQKKIGLTINVLGYAGKWYSEYILHHCGFLNV